MVGKVCFFFLRFVQRERTGRQAARPKAGQRSQTAETVRRTVWPAAQCFGLQKAEKFHNQSGMVGTASGGMGQV